MSSNKLKTGVVISYLAAGMSMVVSILYTPFMVRSLGPSEHGVYQIVYAIAGYLSLLSFGFGSAYIRFYSKYTDEDKDRKIASLNGMFMTVFCVLALICCVVGFGMIPFMGSFFKGLTPHEIETTRTLLFFLVINVALTFPNSVLDSYIIAHEEFVFQKLIYLVKTVFNPLLTIPFLLLGFKSITLVLVTTFLTAVSFVANWIFCKRRLGIRFCFSGFERGLFKEVSVFSSFIFLNIVTDQINWNLDKVLLGRLGNSTDASVYGLATQLNTYYMDCSILVSSVFIPRIHRLVNLHDADTHLNRLFVRVGRIQFMILAMVCSGFLFFGQQFVVLWAGEGYRELYPLTLALLIAVTVPMIQNVGIEIQKAKNMHKFRSLVYVGIALIHLSLSWILIPHIGMLGCTVGTVAGLVLGNGIIMNIYYHKRIGINIKAFWSRILRVIPALLLPCAAGVAYMLWVKKTALTFVLGLSLYVALYMLSMYLFGMNEEERELIKKPLYKIKSIFGSRCHD